MWWRHNIINDIRKITQYCTLRELCNSYIFKGTDFIIFLLATISCGLGICKRFDGHVSDPLCINGSLYIFFINDWRELSGYFAKILDSISLWTSIVLAILLQEDVCPEFGTILGCRVHLILINAEISMLCLQNILDVELTLIQALTVYFLSLMLHDLIGYLVNQVALYLFNLLL